MAEVIKSVTEEEISNYILVDTADKLDEVIKSLAESKKIAIDTEFVKISTLHPIVALIQIFDGNKVFLIDPIALNEADMKRFWTALNSSEALFIFFAMHEDLDLIYYYSQKLPKNIVDLQLMAGFIGGSTKAGLAATIENYLGITILKDQTTSVWMQRPLTNEQIRYGAVDVLYLIKLYDLFNVKLSGTDKEKFFLEEMEVQKEQSIEPYDEKLGYLKFVSGHMTMEEKAKLRALLNYRQSEAERQNICLKMVVPNSLLIPMVKKSIRTIVNLEKLGMHWKSIRLYGKQIISLLNQREYDFSNLIVEDLSIPNKQQDLTNLITERCRKYASENEIDLLIVLSSKRCKEALIYLSATVEDQKNLPIPVLLKTRWKFNIFSDLLLERFPEYDFESNFKYSQK